MTVTKLLSIPEFAKATGISVRLARELVNRGDVPSVRVGPRRRVDIRFVEKWTADGCQHTERSIPVQPSL
jgi:excisionase family DNA binding protein